MTVLSDRLWISVGYFVIGDVDLDDGVPGYEVGTPSGIFLMRAGPSALLVQTALATGNLEVRVRCARSKPEGLSREAEESVVTVFSGKLIVIEPEYAPGKVPLTLEVPPGLYRVCVDPRNRRENADLSVFDSNESYDISIWPENEHRGR